MGGYSDLPAPGLQLFEVFKAKAGLHYLENNIHLGITRIKELLDADQILSPVVEKIETSGNPGGRGDSIAQLIGDDLFLD